MNGNYVNQAEVDKVQNVLNDISPGLRISILCVDNRANAVTYAGVQFPIKGNAETIKKLTAAGFRNEGKYKIESKSTWPERDGFSFGIRMTYYLPKLSKEG